MVRRCLIDPSGVAWDLDLLAAYQEASHISIFASDQTIIDALVMDKGYGGLRVSDTACHVFINPTKIGNAALSALVSAVSNQDCHLIVSGCYVDRWRFKIHSSKNDGINYILELASQHRKPTNVKSRELSQSALERSNTPELANIMDLIGESGGRINSDLINKISLLTNRRFLVCSWHGERHVWRVEHSGPGYGNSHLNLAYHQVLGNQPAYEYGCWAHDRYLQVKEMARPVVEEVDALMFAPDVGYLRAGYRRMLAPMTDDNGDTVMLSTSMRDSTIDLTADRSGVPLE